ncbi:MAG: MgtC/SapB family protein [Sphingorhabdus sp.]|uniref:MgtC/SapB family protein n=1 Tax=Sphingorhabdus sp. TaxID=1902408 RepID=UPI0025CC8709|nr:MgtC/SapB family protein [Sphingorhabdus sp.]MCO4091747.1 MgtC/SapB family protein [Sphingorhabdus sp.]
MIVGDLAYRDLGVAIAAGLLVGIERGWRQRDVTKGSRVAGVRTFALLGGLGGMIGLLARQHGIFIPAILLGGAVIMLIMGYARSMPGPKDVSVTNVVAALLTLCLGILATSGQPALAMAAAAVVTMILASRSGLHALIQKLGEEDVIALARFAIIAGAIWPFLPDARYGPLDAWNPQQLWLVVVFVTGLSFASYVASRNFGAEKGILITAAIGGAYSSTAVTALLSHRLRNDETGHGTLSAGIALATSIMFVRVLLLTAVIADFAFLPVLRLVGFAVLAGVIAGLVLLRDRSPVASQEPAQPRNPIAIIPAIGFLVLVAIMAVAARWAEARFGGGGALALITAIGVFDVDAAIITLGGLTSGSIDRNLAGLALSGAVLANMLVKIGVVILYAGFKRGRSAILALSAGAVSLAGACVLVIFT